MTIIIDSSKHPLDPFHFIQHIYLVLFKRISGKLQKAEEKRKQALRDGFA